MFIRQEENNNSFELVPQKSESVLKTLEAGVYYLKLVRRPFGGSNIYLEKNNRYKGGQIINTGVFKEARDHVDFFVDKDAYVARKELGLMNKLALIFNGGPGTGKTYLAGQLMEKLVKENNAICLMCKGEPGVDLHSIIDGIRLEDPDRFVGILIDEYEKSKGDELEMLSFLDGTNSRDNMLLIATVNSTKKLPETIINRIGRIERVYNFDTEDIEIIKAMINSVIPEKYKEHIQAEDIAKEFKEYNIKPSIDFITVLIRNKIYEHISGKDAPLLLENIAKLKERNSKKKKNKIGFKVEGDNREETSKAEEDKEMEFELIAEARQEMLEDAIKSMLRPN